MSLPVNVGAHPKWSSCPREVVRKPVGHCSHLDQQHLFCWNPPSGAVGPWGAGNAPGESEEHGAAPSPGEGRVSPCPTFSAAAPVTPVACFLPMESKRGESSPRAVAGGLLLPVSARGGGQGDGKVPAPAVSGENLCPGDAVGSSDPSSPLPLGIQKPLFHGACVPFPPPSMILASPEASAPLRQPLCIPAAWLSLSLSPKPDSGTDRPRV